MANPGETRLLALIAKLAPPLFVDKEGGGHDLGMWLDCGDLDEWEYGVIQAALNGSDKDG